MIIQCILVYKIIPDVQLAEIYNGNNIRAFVLFALTSNRLLVFRYVNFCCCLQTHIEQLQERIRSVQGEKSEIQKQLSSASAELIEVETSKSAIAVEAEGLKRALDGVKRQLASKDQDAQDQIEQAKQSCRKRYCLLLYSFFGLK